MFPSLGSRKARHLAIHAGPRGALRRVGVRSQPVPVALVGECAMPAVARELNVVPPLRAIPTATCPMPTQESGHERSAWRARSYEGREHPAKPTAARRS
jgi:hypothetical protein